MDQLRELDTTGWTRDDFREYLHAESYAEMRRIIMSWLAQQDKNVVVDMIRQLRILKIARLDVCRWRMEDKHNRTRQAELESLMNNHLHD